MSNFYRGLPFIISAVAFIAFEIVYAKPTWIFGVGAALPALFFFALYLLMGANLKTPSARFKFLITPTLFTWSALAFTLMVESALARHLIAFVVLVFLVLFFESIVTYIWRHEAYLGYSLENLSSYALTLTLFLATSVLAGFHTLLDLPLGLAAACALLVFFLIHYELFWIGKIPTVPMLLYTGALTLVLLEVFLGELMLPFHFMVVGAITTVLWYTGVSLSRAHLLGLLTKRMAYRHLVLGGALLLILFFAA